jgi:predicted transcriptional regulator
VNGFIIRSPFVDWILAGKKNWEIRGRSTHVRGKIALIRGGSGLIVGTCELVKVVGPLTLRDIRKNARKLAEPKSEITWLPYETTYAWVLKNARKFPRPRRYKHPSGAVIWVRLRSV